MAKFYGRIGFVREVTEGDITTETYHEAPYKGDYLNASVKLVPDGEVNDDLQLENRISIMMDSFCRKHFETIRYVVIGEQHWKVTKVELKWPRMLLTVGGVYNVS